MKTKIILIALTFLVGMGLQSCSKSKTHDFSEIVPEVVKADFETRFPAAKSQRWAQIGNILKAEFVMNNTEYDAWYQNTGSWNWIRTEQDVRNNASSIPQAIQNYITTNFAGWRIDDIDLITTPSDTFYEIELEKNGERDVILLIKADGTVINTFIDDDDNDHITPANIPIAVLATFDSKYPTAVRVKWEREGTLYEADFLLNNEKHEAFFEAEGAWVYTKKELRPILSILPAAVQSHINTNYAGWKIDDVDFIMTPSNEYYMIELEKGAMEAILRIKADGTLVTL